MRKSAAVLGAVIVAAATLMTPLTANAVISATSGQITKIPPPAEVTRTGVGGGSTTTSYVWDERQNVTLASALSVDIAQLGTYDTQSSTSPTNIAAGTVVDSHFFDSVRPLNSGTTVLTGTLTFSSEILGIIVTKSRLTNSNSLGSPGTDYSTSGLNTDMDLGVTQDAVFFTDLHTVTIRSSEGNSLDQLRVITKRNNAPTVNAGGPYAGAETGSVTLGALASDPESDPLLTSWSFVTTAASPGTVCTPSATNTLSPSITCNDDAVITATASVTDPFHSAVTSSAQITFANVAPALGALTAPTGQIPLASTVNISANFTDISPHDTHTATVAWGDTTSGNATITETNGSGSLAASHNYTSRGIYTILVTLRDDDGGISTGTVQVTINGPPTASAGGPYSGFEGTARGLTGTATDPEPDPLTTTWNITPTSQDPGTTCTSTGTSTLLPSVTCNDNAVLSATLTASDGINAAVVSNTTVTIANVAPVLGVGSITAGPIPVGANVHVGAPFTDAGTHDTHTATVNWGDLSTTNATISETPGVGTLSADHAYTHAGLYVVTVTLSDDNLGTDVQTLSVLVNTPPTVSAGGPYVGSEGSQLLLSATALDTDGDTLTYSWTYTVSGAHSPSCPVNGAGTHAPTLTLVCNDDAVVSATVTVSDGVNTVQSSANLTVGNVAPVAGAIVQSPSAPSGQTVAISVPFSDAGTNDTHTASISWGDSSSSAGTVGESAGNGAVIATHAYATDGHYIATVTITDDDGDSVVVSRDVVSDTTAPVITASVDPAPNGAGWNNSPVTVSWTIVDSLTPIDTTSGCDPVTRSTDTGVTGVTYTCTASSQGGTASASATVKLDQVAPNLSGAATTPPNVNGWYNGPVTIHWTCSDALSGIAGSCPPNATLSSEGSAVTSTAAVSDVAGNTTNESSNPVKIDTHAPTTSAATLPEWNNDSVTVVLSASDTLSGIDVTNYRLNGGAIQSGAAVLLTDEGTHNVEFWSTDNAGNVEAHHTVTVKVDKTAPSISVSQAPLANVAGWNNTNVAVTFTCGDSFSGVAFCTPVQTISSEGSAQPVSGTAIDNAGNSASAATTLNIDKTAPSISGSVPTANGYGWYNAPVSVSFVCADGLSGVASCAASQTLSSDGAGQSVSGAATDTAGNSSSTTVSGINIDQTAPTITASTAPAANGAGWNNSAVTVHFVCSDATSGFVSGACPDDEVVSSEGDTTVPGSVTDRAGNTATTSATVHVDTIDPSIVGAQTPAANGAGWNNTDVTVSFTCTDSGSGIATAGCTAPYNVEEGADQSVTGTATDLADNSATTTVDHINVDKTAPTLSGAPTTPPNSHGWYNGPVTIHWTCSDALSGIDGTCPADSLISGEGTDLTVSASVSDVAGNNTAATSVAVDIDTTAPVTTQSSVPNWSNGSVAFTLDASDSLSGVDVTRYTIDGGAEHTGTNVTVSGEGIHSVAFWSVDNAGNIEAAHTATVQIDTTAPSITVIQSPDANGAGWNNTDVTVTFACGDSLSGLASCTPPQTVTSEGSGQSVSGSAVDNAGNSASISTTLNIDKTPPSINGSVPAANGAGWYRTPVTVSFLCDDALSGVASCPSAVTLSDDGAAQSVTRSVSDNAGNSTSTTVNGISIDQVAPTLIATVPAAPSGWYSGPVTVDWTCSDNLSGVTSCPANEVVSDEGITTLAQTITDLAGNTTTTDVTIRIDQTAPAIVGTATPLPNGNGWNNTDVNVSFACSDNNGSGVASCSAPTTLGEGTGQSVTGHATDVAGNASTATVSGINVDKTAPTLSGAATTSPNGAGWYKTAVTIHWTCGDARSGVNTATCPANDVISSEGTAQQVSRTVLDLADNATTASSAPVKIDLTAPTTAASAVGSTYTNSDVTVTLTPTDNLSGVAQTVYAKDGGANTVGTSATFTTTGVHTLTYSSTDVAGNIEATHTVIVRIDNTAPTITASKAPAANLAGWNNTNVVVTFTCTDADAGIASCSAPQTISTQGAGQIVSGSAVDNAGNVAAVSTSVSIDKTAPTIVGSLSATANANGWFRVPVAVSFACGDALSGLATCSGPTTLGQGAGQSVTGTATDVAGNSATATVSPVNVDLTAPTITATPDRAPDSGGSYNGPVTIHFTCTDALSGIAAGACPADVVVSNDGTTTVSGSTTDRAGNTASTSAVITVTVSGVGAQKQALLISINNAMPGASNPAAVHLKKARDTLAASLDPALWGTGNHLQVSGGVKVFDYEAQSVSALDALVAGPHPTITTATVNGWVAIEVNADRVLAATQVSDVIAASGNTAATSAAQAKIALGDTKRSSGLNTAAIEQYKNAWKDVT